MQPESSDGFASVGTILPEERAALLPGGSFRFWALAVRQPRFAHSLVDSQTQTGPRLTVGLLFLG